MSVEDKKLINPWNVIDTFFRNTNYYKSQHQIDSYDEFLFSKQNGIDNIIRRENPFILYKGENPTSGKFSYEIRIYYGETLNDEGNIIEGKNNIFISPPAIYDDNKLSELLKPRTQVFSSIKILPETEMLFILGSRFKQAKESKDLPQPEGPTIAVVVFFFKEKLIFFKTTFSKPLSKKEIERFFISKTTPGFKTNDIDL